MGEMDDGFEGMRKRCRELGTKARKQSVSELIDSAVPEDDTVDEDLLFSVVSAYLGDGVFAQRFVNCMEIIRRKNADYSQGEQKHDRIAAFKRIARDIDVPVRKAWAVFAQKHWGAIMRYVKEGILESEPIDGRINDLINYLVLLGSIVDWEADFSPIGEGE